MKITNFYEIQTESLTATKEEIATVLVNTGRGSKLREIYAKGDSLYFVMEQGEVGE